MHKYTSALSFVFVLLWPVLFFGISAPHENKASGESVKNVILFIGDGMGYNQIELTQELLEKKLFITTLPVSGTVLTSSGNQWVTDSAAAASAIATGYKIKNHTVSINNTGKKIPTLLEIFQKNKKKAGIVTTSEIVDATPAAFATHVHHRKEKNKIAEIFRNKKIDLLFGGGRRYFLPHVLGGSRTDGRDLIREMKKDGYQYISKTSELKQIKKLNSKLLGLFHDLDFNYVIDREEIAEMALQPSLEDMTKKALDLLSPFPSGFFLMVEGALIDHAAHQYDVAAMALEMNDFDHAVQAACHFAKNRSDTLVVVTADHETGGLTPSEATHHDILKKLRVSAAYIAREIKKHAFEKKTLQRLFKTHTQMEDLTEEEVNLIQKAKSEEDFYVGTVVGSLIAKRGGIEALALDMFYTGNTHGHTSLPVPIFGFGTQATLFTGFMENSEIPQKIARATRVSFRIK